MAGGRRRRPEVAGSGQLKAPSPRQKWECKSSTKIDFWSFAKGVSESEAITRRKEYDEERKMAWSLVAKVEYMVVEMVEKVVVEMGYLVEKKRKKKMVEVVLWLLLLLEWRRERWWNWWWKWWWKWREK